MVLEAFSGMWLIALIVTAIGLTVTFLFQFTALRNHQWFSPAEKHVVLTGCDSGIGLEVARHLASKGTHVIASVLKLSSDGAQQLKLEFGDKIDLIELDLCSRESIQKFFTSCSAVLGARPLHALINNAGVFVFGDFDFLTDGQIDRQVEVNLLGPMRLIKLFLPRLIRDKGRVVNISSINHLQTFPRLAVYTGTKSAIEAFSESLRMELSRFGVHVCIVRLGDYARLTQIMAQHQTVMDEQEKNLGTEKRLFYGDYFRKVHQSALTNRGFFSPPSYEESSLFSDFDRVIYAVDPPRIVMPATFTLKLLMFVFTILPKWVTELIIVNGSNAALNRIE